MIRLLTLAATLFLAAPVFAHEMNVGDLQIIHPHIPLPAKTAKTAGGYLTISNSGTKPDRLIGVESDIAEKVALHESSVDANGLGSMTAVEILDIPAGDTVNLERGGLHIMLMGLKTPLVEGQTVKGALIFEQAGRIEVEFMIDPADTKPHAHGASD